MTDRRIAQRFSVHATLEEGKLGTLYWTYDEERGASALLLVLAAAAQGDDATLQAVVADQPGGVQFLTTYAYGRSDEGAWLATEATALTPEAAPLEALLKRRDRVDLPQILRLAVALARAVETLDTAGKRHLDIQPNRVWLASGSLTQGAPQLFGIGWWRLLPAYQNGAQAEAFYGNPEFLAAEICKGQPASATADVYGAATTIWALAAGKPPFPSNQPLMAMKRQAVEKPLRLDLVKPALQGVKDLQAIVADALDKDPAKRPAPAAWRATVEGLAGQKAPEALDQGTAVAVAAQPVAVAPIVVEDVRATMQFVGSDVAAALAAAPSAIPAPVETPVTPEPADEAATLASLPDAPNVSENNGAAENDGDEDDDAADAGGGRQGRRRRERRERQTVAGIGIAAALAEANLSGQKVGAPGLAGLTPKNTATLPPTQNPLSAVPAAAKASDAPPPKRPDSDAMPRVVIKNQANEPSTAAVARTGRSLTVQLAEGAFFDEDAVSPSAAVDLGDQVPPTPPKEGLNRKALVAIGAFAALMAGVSLWMSQRPTLPDAPATPEAAAPAEEAVAIAEDATSVAEAPPAPVTPAEAPAPASPVVAPAPAEVVPTPAQPDAGQTADTSAAAAAPTAVAPAPAAAVPMDTVRQAEVQHLVNEGNSALMTKDPVTALAKAEQALKINAGHAPALLLRQQAQKAVDAAIAEAKAAEAKAVEAKAAEAKVLEAAEKQSAAAKSKAEAAQSARTQRESKASAKREAQKAAAKRAAAAREERAAAAQEAAAAKATAAKERAASKKTEKPAEPKKAEKEAAPARSQRPEARPQERPAAEEGTSATQEASKFAALAQKASKAKLKVLYLQKAVKLDPGNAGYKTQLKAAEEQLKTEAP